MQRQHGAMKPQASRRPAHEKGAAVQFTRAEMALAEAPRAEQIRRLRAAADSSPRLAQLRALTSAVAARPSPVLQRVRFDQTSDLTTAHVAPAVLPDNLAKAAEGLYAGETKDLKKEIDKPPGVDAWLTDTHHMAATPNKIWAEVRAKDWETLGLKDWKTQGPKTIGALEAESMNLGFFQQQNVLVDELKDKYQATVAKNPGRPIRVASFQFERTTADGPLTNKITKKTIEKAITEFIENEPLLDKQDTGELQAKVQANINQTLFSSTQYQWLAANWNSFRDTHDVIVDVDFYPDRMPGLAGLHKDSVGDTLFVNLTYTNADEGIAPEYLIDNKSQEMLNSDMPEASKALVRRIRQDNVGDQGDIKGNLLPERGRVSFVDPAVWHSTPVYGRRAEVLNYGDADMVKLSKVASDLRLDPTKQGRGDTLFTAFARSLDVPPDVAKTWGSTSTATFTVGQWLDYVAKLRATNAGKADTVEKQIWAVVGNSSFDGATLKARLRDNSFGGAGFVTKNPADGTGVRHAVTVENALRRERARSIYLRDNPDKLGKLEQASTEPRSFIRTWVMLIKK